MSVEPNLAMSLRSVWHINLLSLNYDFKVSLHLYMSGHSRII